MPIPWSDSLLVDHPEMDRTHAEFVRLLAQVSRALEEDKCAVAVARFRRLVSHTEAHFQQEEQWMQACDCPLRAAHTEQHTTVLRLMRKVLELESSDEMCQRLRVVVGELAAWFPRHAKLLDGELARHMGRVGMVFEPTGLAPLLRAAAID